MCGKVGIPSERAMLSSVGAKVHVRVLASSSTAAGLSQLSRLSVLMVFLSGGLPHRPCNGLIGRRFKRLLKRCRVYETGGVKVGCFKVRRCFVTGVPRGSVPNGRVVRLLVVGRFV
uniref:Uncharacterized protein n=1 Tax=Cacopsylla melanoneura TaxID=428564 RepID=A0A8D8Z3C1_9HEMI